MFRRRNGSWLETSLPFLTMRRLPHIVERRVSCAARNYLRPTTNVLVVEHHWDTHEVFGLFLESLGYRFKLALAAGSVPSLAAVEGLDVLIIAG